MILAFLSLSQTTNALYIKAAEEISLNEELKSDAYVAAWSVAVNSFVKWDLITAWWELNITWEVQEDLLLAWGTIDVSWKIWDDARIFWWDIRINSEINGDLFIFWGNIKIWPNAHIYGNLIAWWWRVVISGKVDWYSNISAGQLSLDWNLAWNVDLQVEEVSLPSKIWVIWWNLNYSSSKKNLDLESIVKWQSSFKELKEHKMDHENIFDVYNFLFIFVFSSLFFLFFEKFYKKMWAFLAKNPKKSFLYGIWTYLLLPLIIILFFISIIWIPFGFFTLFVYIFVIVSINLINTIVLTWLVVDKYKLNKFIQKILILLVFSLIFTLLPYYIGLIIWIFTVWAALIVKLNISKEAIK